MRTPNASNYRILTVLNRYIDVGRIRDAKPPRGLVDPSVSFDYVLHIIISDAYLSLLGNSYKSK